MYTFFERDGDEDRDRADFEVSHLHAEALDCAMFLLDSEGHVRIWPDIAEQFYGFPPEAVVSRYIDILFATTRETPPLREILDEESGSPIRVASWHRRADESTFWATCTISPMSDESAEGYIVVCQDTTSREQYERTLEQQYERLNEAIALISHDFRMPLSVIDGRMGLYRKTADERHLSAIEETTDRMAHLVEDLLDVVREGHVIDHPEPTDLKAVLDVATEGALPEDATFEYEPVPLLLAAPNRIIQVFENLLRNAVDHGREDVTVRVGPLDDGVYIEDDGPGIPEGDRERVFGHGYTTHECGTGYGLSVVRAIVGAHGWEISVAESESGGARFEVTGIEFVNSQ